jgi:hypothetical protein
MLNEHVLWWLGVRLSWLANPIHHVEIQNAQPCMVLTLASFREIFSEAYSGDKTGCSPKDKTIVLSTKPAATLTHAPPAFW